jgi:uncharacterized protein (PEP-CTERM system associated)
MIKNKIQKNRWTKGTRQALGAVLSITLSGTAMAGDWKFTAGIGATETYTDNVDLTSSGRQQSDFVTSITPSFGVKKDGARLKVDAQYSLQDLFYAQDSARNTLYQHLNAHANAELYEQEIFLDAAATISQTAISPLLATGVDNINAPNNITNVRTFSLSPYLAHRFGSTATLLVRDTVSKVTNDTSTIDNSTNNTINAGLVSGSDFGRHSWGLNFSQQNANYQNGSNVKLATTSANLGYLVTPRLRLVGTVGNESNQFHNITGDSSPGGVFWNTTASWSPSVRTSIELGYGHHFYGNDWNFAFKTRGHHYTWNADYVEGLNTSNNQFATSGLGVTNTQQLVSYNQNILTNQVFLSKRFTTAFSWSKGKSDINVAAFHSIETTHIDQNVNTQLLNLATSGISNIPPDIFLLTNNVKQVGLNGAWTWKFNPRLSSNVSLGVTRDSYSDLNRADTTSTLQLGLNRQFSSDLYGSVSLRHQARSSDQNASDYTENSLSGSVNYKF